MRLAKSYCREIIRELDKIPVYLPGTPVQIGDIISFSSGLARPIGTFTHVSSLSNLNIAFPSRRDSNPDPYIFASKGSVGISFTGDVNATTQAKGKLDISFKKEGSIYLAGANCTTDVISDLSNIGELLKPHANRIDWEKCFIVTSVTTAQKALIMQANTSSASLSIEGNVQGLQPDANLKLDASVNLKITSYKDSSFIKDWSDNVTLFFDLARYKKLSGKWALRTDSLRMDQEKSTYQFIPVLTEDLAE